MSVNVAACCIDAVEGPPHEATKNEIVSRTGLLDAISDVRTASANFFALIRRGRRSIAHARERRRLAGATYMVLRNLDAHTLRDIGLHRSESGSVAAEIAGAAEPTRIHVLHAVKPATNQTDLRRGKQARWHDAVQIDHRESLARPVMLERGGKVPLTWNRPLSLELYYAARRAKAKAVGDSIIAALRWVLRDRSS